MKKKEKLSGVSILFGITFIAPVTYSIKAYEMDVVQRMFFFVTSILLFLVYLRSCRIDEKISINKLLFIFIIIFPFTFITSFFNGSSSLLLLQLSDLIIPISILLQSTLLFLILGEERFFKVVSISVVIVSAIFSFIGVLEVFQIKIIDLPTVIAPGSTLGHRSFAAEFLLPSLPFLLILREYVPVKKRIYLVVPAILNVSFLLFTRNRSGIIILAVLLMLYIFFVVLKKERGTRFKTLTPVLGIILISFLISFIPVKGTERPDLESTASTVFDTEYKSNMLRLSFWDASLQMVRENPIAGIGLFKWSGYYPKYNRDYFTDETVTHIHSIHSHNDFLELFAENGILSSLIFLLIYVSITMTLLKRTRFNQKYFYFLLTFLATFAYSLVAFPNHKFASYFLCCVIAGTALLKLNETESNSISLNFNYLKWGLLISLILGGVTSYIKIRSEFSFGEAMFLKTRSQYPMMFEKLGNVSEIFYPYDTSKQPVDYYRGIANSFMGKFPEALKDNLSGKELAPYNPTIMRNIASSYYSMKKYDKTIEQLEKIKTIFPNYIAPQYNLLEMYVETKQEEKAISLYSELEKKVPESPVLLEFQKRYNLRR